MIRNLLATTAIATLVATSAYAQTNPAPADTTQPAATDSGAADSGATAPTGAAPEAANPSTDGHLASNLIGETVYNGTGEDAENIGDVNDLVIGTDGSVEAIVVGVGGFLGIGEKRVALNYSEIDWAERDGDRWIVVAATEEQLKELPAFDTAAFEPDSGAAGGSGVATDQSATQSGSDTVAVVPAPSAPANEDNAAATDDQAAAPAEDTAAAPAPATDDTAAAPADDSAAAPADDTAAAPATDTDTTVVTTDNTEAAPAEETAQAPAATDAPADQTAQAPAATDTETTGAVDRSSLKPLETSEISAEEFVGTTVYGANDETIGEIGDVILDGDKVDAVIVDVGGFLGMGEKPIAVALDNLAFLTDENGERYLYTEWTKEQLEAQTAYDEGSYAENRDTMRMVSPN